MIISIRDIARVRDATQCRRAPKRDGERGSGEGRWREVLGGGGRQHCELSSSPYLAFVT